MLAEGTVVNKPTLGIFGEAGTEAVIPLKRNTQGLDLIAEKLADRLSFDGDSGNGATYVINFVLENGKVLTKMVIDNIKDMRYKLVNQYLIIKRGYIWQMKH